MKKIIVTGGTGYIGSHTAVELQQKGYNVVIIDNLSNSKKDVLNGIKNITGILPQFAQIDICNQHELSAFFQQNTDAEAIIHFAAYKAVGESVEDSLKYYQNNLVSLINLLHEMKKHSIKNLVFSSSCTVYGQPKQLPVTEQSPIIPANSPYGNTKQISEEIIRDAIHSYKSLNATLLRYFNPIGAHPSAQIGELPIGVPNNLIPFITQTVAGKREKLKVFGNDYNTPDGSCIRDYINVVDLAKAHVVAIERMLHKKMETDLEIFNLGTGKGLSVLEILHAFEKATGKKVAHEIVDRRPGDIEQVWADTTLANKVLGWKAIETIEDTLASAWNWEKQISKIS